MLKNKARVAQRECMTVEGSDEQKECGICFVFFWFYFLLISVEGHRGHVGYLLRNNRKILKQNPSQVKM